MSLNLPVRAVALSLMIALAFAALQPAKPARAAESESTLLVNLTTDDVWTNQMALGFAKRIADRGDRVVIFLNVRAVTLASKAVPPHAGGVSGKTAHDMLRALMDAGVEVFLCPSCTKQAGLSMDDRLQGIKPGSKAFLDIVMAPGTRIMNY